MHYAYIIYEKHFHTLEVIFPGFKDIKVIKDIRKIINNNKNIKNIKKVIDNNNFI